MCTSNTDMKIDTRTIGASPNSPTSSRGTGTRWIIVTSPSAGATIRSSPCGVVRTGSRKNAATQMHRPTNGQNRTWLIAVAIRVSPPAIRTYLRPSGWTAGKRHLTVSVGRAAAGGGVSSDDIRGGLSAPSLPDNVETAIRHAACG